MCVHRLCLNGPRMCQRHRHVIGECCDWIQSQLTSDVLTHTHTRAISFMVFSDWQIFAVIWVCLRESISFSFLFLLRDHWKVFLSGCHNNGNKWIFGKKILLFPRWKMNAAIYETGGNGKLEDEIVRCEPEFDIIFFFHRWSRRATASSKISMRKFWPAVVIEICWLGENSR